jgi:hypothetical protein
MGEEGEGKGERGKEERGRERKGLRGEEEERKRE